jgi:DNA invertase Pin-like site-specific DNA recombinase
MQVQSIDAQLVELRNFAKTANIEIVDELIEKRTAKMPGRPIFNAMLDRIENGEAEGILSWNPDRLARNSVDGGRVIYLVDTGAIKALKFPTFWFEPTPQGLLMLNLSFGQSKYYVDALSENTKRGIKHKCRMGWYPSVAPLGYMNDVSTKTIKIDKRTSIIVTNCFKMYAEGDKTFQNIADYLQSSGVLARTSNKKHVDFVKFMLTNSFYRGILALR